MFVWSFFLRRRSRVRSMAARPRPLQVEALEVRCLLSYTVTDLGTLGGPSSGATGINNRGQVVGGAYLPCNCMTDPFLWWNGVLGNLGDFGQGGANYANAINDLAQVVGQSAGHVFLWSRGLGMMNLGFTGDGYHINNLGQIVGQVTPVSHAFLWKDGNMQDLGTLGGGGSAATGINDAGLVVGQASGPNFLHAFAWTQGTDMWDLGTLDGDPASSSGAVAVNNRNQIVGNSYSHILGTTRAVVYRRDGIGDLGALASYSVANALNDLGEVVGQSGTQSGDLHAFRTDVYTPQPVDLNTEIPSDSGWLLFDARGVNNAGQIIGSGDFKGQVHAYLLTPVNCPLAVISTPEPSWTYRDIAGGSSGLKHGLGTVGTPPPTEAGQRLILSIGPDYIIPPLAGATTEASDVRGWLRLEDPLAGPL
jgi:probable HAF family extracellular repeat protein